MNPSNADAEKLQDCIRHIATFGKAGVPVPAQDGFKVGARTKVSVSVYQSSDLPALASRFGAVARTNGARLCAKHQPQRGGTRKGVGFDPTSREMRGRCGWSFGHSRAPAGLRISNRGRYMLR